MKMTTEQSIFIGCEIEKYFSPACASLGSKALREDILEPAHFGANFTIRPEEIASRGTFGKSKKRKDVKRPIMLSLLLSCSK